MKVFLLLSLLAPVAVLSQFYLPLDCDELYQYDNTKPSGVYTIYPGGPTTPLHVYCDMNTEGGRWTVFQRRMDGTENFFRPWETYKSGFGNVAGEYWLGLDNIFLLTMRKKNELRVDMEDFEGGKVSAKYTSFSIDPENYGYTLRLGSYVDGGAGNTSSALTSSSPMATILLSVGACTHANPNSLYAPHQGTSLANMKFFWQHWKGVDYSLKSISFKIRAVSDAVAVQEQE
ncbi:microfibril-associated glycoprotein 4-like [Oncorhynchus kisutch]|uniref:microfibril-associated glycoprotein 4-like n=1 Tax=Oncorhynchus kisutch TaxID=8019 RepID=UPI0012DF6887|nr:microfibril-associated glycoprotein 4-like [Oncorhynchus kisutch]